MRFYITLILLFVLVDISSAQYLYHQLEERHSADEIRKDIDQLYTDLKKHHLQLYQYIKKTRFEWQIDSLKSSIENPLTSADLYLKLLPLLSEIGDGHLKIDFFEPAKVTDSDYLKYGRPYLSPFEQLNLKIINGKIFIIENQDRNSKLTAGSEIVSINDLPSFEIIKNALQKCFSDGYNSTFKYFLLNNGNLTNIWQIFKNKDSLNVVFRQGNILDSTYLIGKPYDIKVALQNSKHKGPFQLKFLDYKELGTHTAYLKVNTFTAKLEQADVDLFNNQLSNMENLVLDLRGNTGGDIFLMCHFLKFFIKKPICPIEFPQELIKGVLLPTLDSNRRKQINYVKEFNRNGYGKLIPFSNAYKNKLYILVNGGTFSATSIFANTLSLAKRGILIGEETGGGRNNINAGTYFNSRLKNTAIVYSIGMIPFKLPEPSLTIGHGIIPDIKINYTLEDYLDNKDLELNWAIQDIKKKGNL